MKTLFAILFSLTIVCLAQVTGPKISVLHKEFNFGDVKQNSFVEHDFIITNNGGDSLVINSVNASCGCTAAKPEKNVLKPGESTKINVKFNTIGREGHQQKYVYVATNDKENPELRLGFTANVIAEVQAKGESPKLVLSALNHDFGKVIQGKTAEWTVNFKNTGSSTLEIKDVKTSCGCTAAVVSGRRIKPGESGNLRIEFDSTNKMGKLSRTVTISSNDPVQPEQTIVIYADVQNN